MRGLALVIGALGLAGCSLINPFDFVAATDGGLDAGAAADGAPPDGGADAGAPDGGLARCMPNCAAAEICVGGVTCQGVSAVTGGDRHTCALLDGGDVFCWGDNADCRLGDCGSPSGVPVLVPLGDAAIAIDAGRSSTCAVLGNGHVWCWGNPADGRLGNPRLTDGARVEVPGINWALRPALDVAVGDGHACVIFRDDDVACWGRNDYEQAATGGGAPVDGATEVTELDSLTVIGITAGDDFTCALADGAVHCWGHAEDFRLGQSLTGSRPPNPVSVPGFDSASAVVAGARHACALQAGQVYCWGANELGQAGQLRSATARMPTAVTLTSGSQVDAIASGNDHACALLADGSVHCWGDNRYEQLGRDTFPDNYSDSPAPMEAEGLRPPLGLTSNAGCALRDGDLVCWGDNRLGQLGIVPVVQPTPRLVAEDVASVAVGDQHACVRLVSGEARCFGRGDFGQLGDATNQSSATLVAPQGLGAIGAVGAGREHSCAVTLSGVECWGAGAGYRLGTGSTSDAATPVDMLLSSKAPTAWKPSRWACGTRRF